MSRQDPRVGNKGPSGPFVAGAMAAGRSGVADLGRARYITGMASGPSVAPQGPAMAPR